MLFCHLTALYCAGLMDELIKALNEMDEDPKIGAIVVTGSEKVMGSC